MPDLINKILRTTTYREIDVEALLDPSHPSWVKFDPELGYVPDDVVMRDGIDYSYSTYTHEPEGHRKMINYADRPCRINTYGNSFTQCQQVSDDETWQERLAAHFGEPIRNFGCGGHGFNQAFRRMMRMEDSPVGARNIILNVFDDDHIRNLDAARWIRTAWNEQDRPPDRALPLHGLPWDHVRYDLEQERFVEIPGLCRSEDDLRALCDPDHFCACFKDDQVVKLFALMVGGSEHVEELEALAAALEVEVDLRNPATRASEAMKLHSAYGFKSTEFLLEKMTSWLAARGKRLLIILSYGMIRIPQFLEGQPRFDQPFIDHLDAKGIPYVDGLLKHVDDYRTFRLSFDDYVSRYYIQAAGAAVFGHYNPLGNLFYAFSVKHAMIPWLDPKPPAYREPEQREGLVVV
jgi:hypothetical protein